MSCDVSILILAAGASTRMQKIKQLLPWGNQLLIEHIVATANGSTARSNYLLLGANAEEIRSEIQGIQTIIVENKDWDQGLGSGIATGVRAILEKERPKAILILLCDQPYVDASYIDRLIQKFFEKNTQIEIVGTQYGSKIGVPAIFSSNLYNDLLLLDKDKGAARLISNNLHHTLAVDPKGKEKDMDTWEDYLEMRPK